MNKTIQRAQLVPALVGLVAFFVLGAWLILNYVEREKERDLLNWQTLLGTVADSRAQSIGQWLDAQATVVKEVAENASVRFYLTQGTSPGSEPATVPAQIAYLRNLLDATAERSHFSGAVAQARVPANIDIPVDSGLVIADRNGMPVAETKGFRTDDTLKAALQEAVKSGKPALQGFYVNSRDEVVLAFVQPIFHVQFGSDSKEPLGAVAGIKRARDEVFPLLARKGTLTSADETLLVMQEGDAVSYLTPLADGTAALRKRLLLSTPQLSEAFALSKPGMFALMRDYAGREVLMTSRAISQTPWVLVQKVDASEALRESREHQRFLLSSLFLTVLAVLAGLVAAWWHGASVKERSIAEDLRAKSTELAHQSALLQSVTDGTPDLIFIVADQHLGFCNKALGSIVGEAPAVLVGKTLTSVFGPATAQPIEAMISDAATQMQGASRMIELQLGEQTRIYFFTAIPVVSPEGKRQVLCICRDMTSEQQVQAKRQALMKQLVTTLTRVVDQHDPYCAEHSARTAQVAIAVGKALGVDAAALESLDLAAKLANIGKMFLPKELLTKVEPLSADEQALLQSHVQRSVEVLKGLEFDGPVTTIIAQKSEHIDGSGYPNGLKGEELLLASRILAVANAFVAMASARAYRAGMPLKETLDKLLSEADSKYDRHVVAALFHVAENRQEWDSWSAPQAGGN